MYAVSPFHSNNYLLITWILFCQVHHSCWKSKWRTGIKSTGYYPRLFYSYDWGSARWAVCRTLRLGGRPREFERFTLFGAAERCLVGLIGLREADLLPPRIESPIMDVLGPKAEVSLSSAYCSGLSSFLVAFSVSRKLLSISWCLIALSLLSFFYDSLMQLRSLIRLTLEFTSWKRSFAI